MVDLIFHFIWFVRLKVWEWANALRSKLHSALAWHDTNDLVTLHSMVLLWNKFSFFEGKSWKEISSRESERHYSSCISLHVQDLDRYESRLCRTEHRDILQLSSNLKSTGFETLWFTSSLKPCLKAKQPSYLPNRLKYTATQDTLYWLFFNSCIWVDSKESLEQI